jgi:excisionase family DNA binding protein
VPVNPFLVPIDGTPYVLVPDRVAARLAKPVGRLLREAANEGQLVHPEVLQVGEALSSAARHHQQASAARHAAPAPPGTASPCSQGDPITTTEAAERIGCTQRNVRALADRGTLPGERTARGWELDPAGVDAYSVHRAEQRTNQEEMS